MPSPIRLSLLLNLTFRTSRRLTRLHRQTPTLHHHHHHHHHQFINPTGYRTLNTTSTTSPKMSTMKQAQVTTWGASPKCITVPLPPVPPANPTPSRDDPVQVKVLAAGLHNLVRGRASGKHYSAKTLPHIPGADGVGTLVPSGQLVYFSAMAVPGAGSFVGYINLPLKATAPIPDGADPVRAAGLLNPVMASWMAIKKRTDVAKLPAGWTCVIVGATSLSGMVAVSVAREFGAGKVVGIARDGKKMEGVTGLDEQIVLGSGEGGLAGTEWNGALDADVILDFIYGEPTLELFKALKAGKPVQYVQIGTMAGRTVDLPGDVLRSKDITIRGTGPGAWEMREVAVEAPKMLKAIAEGRVDAVGYGFKEVKLADIESEWENVEGRMVVVP